MGRTKRLRQRKQNNVTSNNLYPSICLYNYMKLFDWKNLSKLKCRNFINMGRGLCSKAGILAGEVLIELPSEAMITFETLENDKDFLEECRIFSNSVSFQCFLSFFILYKNHQKNDNSALKLYIDTIPKTFSNPYFCRSNELYLVPEIILKHTVKQNKIIRSFYNAFQNDFIGRVCKCCGGLMRDIFTLCDFKWAYFAVNSRSVFLNEKEFGMPLKNKSFFRSILSDEPVMALAPFLDMFNHSDTTSVQTQIVKKDNGLIFRLISNVSYKPYEQIFVSYGNLTNLKLLLEYGFSLKENIHDYFEISLDDIEKLIKVNRLFKGTSFHSNKFKFIRDHNLDDQMFIHAVDGLSHNLQVTLYLLFKEVSCFANVLSHTAFGATINFENLIKNEAFLLIQFKIEEYESVINFFSKLENMSSSAHATVQYMKHCVSYLRLCLWKFN